jgi:hypothetical protein
VLSTGDVCARIESHSCCIRGETYVFEVQSASIAADKPGHAVLHIAAYRQTASGLALTATVRVTAPFPEFERVPTLLTRAFEEWLLGTTTPGTRVH